MCVHGCAYAGRALHAPCTDYAGVQVERIGTTFAAMASREQMSYTMDCLKTSLPASLELLCDAVVNPAFLPQEVEEQEVCVCVCVCIHV
jgi:predicted Zn-dependent peptidase